MNHCIGDDWKRRLAAAFAGTKDFTDTEDMTASLLNLLCGRNDTVRSYVKEKSSLQESMIKLLQNEIMKDIVGAQPPYLDPRPFKRKWWLTEPTDVDSDSDDSSVSDMRHLRDRLAGIEQIIRQYIVDVGEGFPKFYEKARRITVWGSGNSESRSHASAHETLAADMVVQALVQDDTSVAVEPQDRSVHEWPIRGAEQTRTSSFISYFAIEGFLYVSHELPYAVVRKCVETEHGLIRVPSGSVIQLLNMCDVVRRVAIIHACERDATMKCFNLQHASFQCTGSVLNGNSFHVFSREDGYPPRMA